MNTLTFEQEFTRVVKERPQLLHFIRKAIGTEEVQWEMLTTLNVSKIRDYICKAVTGNSAVTYLAIIKAFLALYTDEGLMPCKYPEKILKAKRIPSQHVFLTEEEIERIEKYQPKSECEADVKAAFLIECYLGARRSDVAGLTKENIVDGKIVYISKKTQVETAVPLHRNLRKYLSHNSKERARATFNKTIQRICRNVGITQDVQIFYHGKMQKKPKYCFVGSHTARRSFCSNLARRGVDIYTIAALAGHNQNITMTQRYIVTDINALSSEAMSFFN